jgi:hypothetical protein
MEPLTQPAYARPASGGGASAAPQPSARSLAHALDYFTEEDLCELCAITPPTAEAWRKRGKGPAYTLAGNSFLYPKAAVREFLDSQIRQRAAGGAAVL